MHNCLLRIISPLPIFFILLLLGFLLRYIQKKRLGYLVFILSFLWLIVISTNLVPSFLVDNLEHKYKSLSDTFSTFNHTPVNIVILGGGCWDNKDISSVDMLGPSTLYRLNEGIRLHIIFRESFIVVSSVIGETNSGQGLIIANCARDLGVNSNAMKILQLNDNNTQGEVQAYYKEFGDRLPLIVVTDAIHMHRALLLFKLKGIDPIPAPVNHLNRERMSFFNSLFPSTYNISKMDAAMHEYLGILWIKLGGH